MMIETEEMITAYVMKYYAIATYASLVGMMLTFLPFRWPSAKPIAWALKKRIVLLGSITLLMCGFVYPTFAGFKFPALLAANQTYLLQWFPFSIPAAFCALPLGWFLMWIAFGSEVRNIWRFAGCMSLLIEPLFLAILIPIFIFVCSFFGAFIVPTALFLNIYRLLDLYFSQRKCICHCHHGKDGRDGQDGQRGEAGPVGPAGRDGKDGRRGAPGRDGRDGIIRHVGQQDSVVDDEQQEPRKVIIQALQLSGTAGHKDFIPSRRNMKGFTLRGEHLAQICGPGRYPTIAAAIQALAKGSVWTLQPTLPAGVVLLHNHKPVTSSCVLWDGDRLTLQSTNAQVSSVTMRVHMRQLEVPAENGHRHPHP